MNDGISDIGTLSAALVFLDGADMITGSSEGVVHVLGWTPVDLIGLPLSSLSTDTPGSYRHKNGASVVLRMSRVPMPQGGSVLAFQPTAETVVSPTALTAEEQLELTLSHSEVIGSWDWDVQNDLVYADEKFATVFGVDPARAKAGLSLGEFVAGIHPDDRARVGKQIGETLQNGELFVSEYRLHDGSGTTAYVLARGRRILGPDGRPSRFPGVVFDVSAKREAELAAALSRRRYESLFEKIEAGFCLVKMIFDENGKPVDYLFLEVNPAFQRQTGITNAAGRRMREISPDHEQHWFDIYGKVARTGEAIRFENEAASLSDRWFSVQAFPVDEPGSGHVAVLFADVSERKRAEFALQSAVANFRTLSEAMLNHVWTATPEGHLDWFNGRTYEFTGRQPGDFDGGRWVEMVHEEDIPRSAATWQVAVESRQPYQGEFRLLRHDGSYHWHLVRAVPVFGDDGQVLRWVGTNTDIERQKSNEAALEYLNATLEDRIEERTHELIQTQEALRQSQKMEAIGNLAGGIAHDFNNLLQVISGNLQLVAKDIVGNERTGNRVTNALSAVQRGARLSAQLLAFSRRQPLDPRVINLGRLIREMDDILRRSLGEAIQIETIISAGLWNTRIDPGNVENAILNLAINARDAMEGRGRLTIEAGNATLDEIYARANSEVTPGQYVMLAVTDNGSGMSPEVLAKVFDPFFTTKPAGKGTGLGLSMVYGFVKQSGGHTKIYSEIGVGTTIRIYLPRSQAAEDVISQIESRSVDGGNETILVAEDDPAVRDTTVSLLKDLGYTVLAAKDADSALTIIESGASVDLLFTDVVMPGNIRSTELARKATERLPGIAVLFTSGYTENSIVHGGQLDEGVNLLSKPYTREALAYRLRQLLLTERQTTARQHAPASNPEPEKKQEPKSLVGMTVLLCEDEAFILMNTADMLQDMGMTVVEATTAGDALRLLENSPCIDLLVTDVGLPDMSGIELARRIKAQRPEFPVVFASGYKDLEGMEGMHHFATVTKPYDDIALKAAIDTVMSV